MLKRSVSLRCVVALLGGLTSIVLLFVNTAHWIESDLAELRSPRRFWEDQAIAVSRRLADPTRAQTLSVGSWRGQAHIDAYQRQMIAGIAERDIRSWQFWRTVSMRRFTGYEVLFGRPSDDSGRARLLSMGFQLFGGVAPYLLPWLGALFAVPLLWWAGSELWRAGSPAAGVLFPLLLVSSVFVIQVLALPYSAGGFYLLGLLTLAALSSHAVLGSPSLRGLGVRTLAAAAAFAICALCRAGTVLLVPGFALALVLGVRRRLPESGLTARVPRRARPWLSTLALLLALVGPYSLIAPSRHHEIWLGIWEGLGDFDRTKGHYWDDPYAKEVLRRAGIEAPRDEAVWADAMKQEAFFRSLVLADILDDPGWYIGILAQRLSSTVTLAKLRPYGPVDGHSVARRTSLQEGAIDGYWGLCTTVDMFGFGPWRREMRVSVLLAPTAILAVIWLAGLLTPELHGIGLRAGQRLLVLTCVGAAGLVSPVLITTASGIEPQAFAVIYLLGAALLLDMLGTALFTRKATPRSD